MVRAFLVENLYMLTCIAGKLRQPNVINQTLPADNCQLIIMLSYMFKRPANEVTFYKLRHKAANAIA